MTSKNVQSKVGEVQEKMSLPRYTKIEFLEEMLAEQEFRNPHYPTATVLHHPNGKSYMVTVKEMQNNLRSDEEKADDVTKEEDGTYNGFFVHTDIPVVDAHPAEQYHRSYKKDADGGYIRDERGNFIVVLTPYTPKDGKEE